MIRQILCLAAVVFCTSCDLDMSGHFNCDESADCGTGYVCDANGQCVIKSPGTKTTKTSNGDETDPENFEGEDTDTESENVNSPAADIPGAIQFVNKEGYAINRNNDANYRGSGVSLWIQNGSAGQQWFWESDGTIRSATDSVFCLNMHYGIKVWSVVNLWDCNDSETQRWIQIDETIRPTENEALCLNLHEYDNQNGAVLNVWECNDNDSQNWTIVEN